MQVNLQTQNNNINFGKLYMPKQKQIAKVFGEETALELDAAKKELKPLAKDVNIYINPRVNYQAMTGGFKILITEKSKNPIKLFFDSFKYHTCGKLSFGEITSENNLKSALVEKVKNTKEQFSRELPKTNK